MGDANPAFRSSGVLAAMWPSLQDTACEVAKVCKSKPAVAAAVGVVVSMLVRKYMNWGKKFPPMFKKGLPLIGPILQFFKDPLEIVAEGASTYGEVFTVDMIGVKMTYLVGREAHHFFFHNDRYLDQGKMYAFTIPVFGKGVLYDVGYDKRTYQLKFVRERLTPESVRSYAPALDDEVDGFYKNNWQGQTEVMDLRNSMLTCITGTSVRALLGPECRASLHEPIRGHKVEDLLHALEDGMSPFSVFMPSAPIPKHRRRDEARRLLQEYFDKIIATRRASSDDTHKDFLSALMGASYPDGTKLSDQEIVGLLVAAYFGSMHNSSVTASWTTLEIHSRPELTNEIRAEVDAVYDKSGDHFTVEAYDSMVKLRAVVTETLRLHPPLMLLMRTITEDVMFKDYTLKRGTVVVVSPNAAHRLPELYDRPNEFDAKRFLGKTPDPDAYIPFGGGRRLCKGQEFGFMQVIAAVSKMMRSYNVELLDGVPAPKPDGMVVAPTLPCRVRYTRRSRGVESM